MSATKLHTHTKQQAKYNTKINVLITIRVNNQIEALFQCIYLFHFSTCFEQFSAHHQENQLYQYIIWYVSLCVGDCLVCRSGRNYAEMHGQRNIKILLITLSSGAWGSAVIKALRY
jgi:hypothetical protein